MSTHIKRIIASAATAAGCALALCLGLAGCASNAPAVTTSTGTAQTITVNATHKVSAVPDTASLSLTITTRGSDAAEASKANGKPTKAVITALKKQGVDEQDIQTTYTDISPTWDENDEENGYQMRTLLTVKGLAIEDVSTIVDTCIDAGATEVDGLQYYVSNYDELYQEALTGAIEASRPKAEAIAQASNVSLGSVVSVTEGFQDTTYAASKAMGATEESYDSEMAQLEPGQIAITAEVTVAYAIR